MCATLCGSCVLGGGYEDAHMLVDRASPRHAPAALAARSAARSRSPSRPRLSPPANRPSGPPQAAPPAPGGVAATVEQCDTTGEQTDRSATFSGEMTAISGTARMAMRIEVQERLPGEELFHTVSAPGLGVARLGVGGQDLPVRQAGHQPLSPAIYRALIRFRWLNDKGNVTGARNGTPPHARSLLPYPPRRPSRRPLPSRRAARRSVGAAPSVAHRLSLAGSLTGTLT